MIPLLFLAASAQAALFSPSLLRRGLDELWNGYNITAAALEIASSISSPTCNSTTYCQTFVKQVIPQCLQLQGTAGCWCTLHDPLHYCAICMSSPTDNTTTAEQTQTALEGHTNYHKGCAAYQAYLNASATSTSMSTSATLSTSTSTGTAAASNSGSSSSLSTGAMVGIIVAGIIGLVLILAVTFLLYRRMQNQSKLHEVTTATGGGGAALGGPREDMSPNGDPQRVTSYYGKMDMNGNVDYSQQTHTNGSVQQPLMFQQQQLQHPHMSPIPSPHSAAPFMPYGDVNSVHPPSSPGYTARPESMMYAGSESDATGSVQQGPLRVMTTSPPPAFNTIYAPQAHYATQANSMTGMASGGGGGVPPGVNEKAVYQGSPSPGRQI